MSKIKLNGAKATPTTKHGMGSLVSKSQQHELDLRSELIQVRTRLKEIYTITKPLREEKYNLTLRHEQLNAEMTGVKVVD